MYKVNNNHKSLRHAFLVVNFICFLGSYKYVIFMNSARGSSTVVEHSNPGPKIEGSNLGANWSGEC